VIPTPLAKLSGMHLSSKLSEKSPSAFEVVLVSLGLSSVGYL
jgi:hypothetical protein